MIEVIDDFLNIEEINTLYDICWYSDFYLAGSDSPEVRDRLDRRWSLSKNIKNDDKHIEFFNSIGNRILELSVLNGEYLINRKLLNAFKFSDILSLHLDNNTKGLESKTAIIYGNKEWKASWGSETVFFDKNAEDADIIKSVLPKPGRLLIFDSNIPHTGRVPSPDFGNYRYGLVFNLSLKNPKKTSLL